MHPNHNIELIAIHIKKTAGMTFKRLLMKMYGRKYYRVNIDPYVVNRTEVFNQRLAELPEDTRVFHGHFRYADALKLFETYPDVPVVTWLRDPVERIVSRYYYSKRKYEDGDQPRKTYMEHYSLLDFAKDERFVNEMSRTLAGCDLADLAFVGLLEHMDEDMAYLAAMLGWGDYNIPVRNTNRTYKEKQAAPTADLLAEVARVNQKDVDLYNYALELRRSRPKLSF